jgi:hypothetical protein
MAPVLPSMVALSLACAAPGEDQEAEGDTYLVPDSSEVASPVGLDTIPGTNWTARDWEILGERVRWAAREGLGDLPMGEALARLGATFVGTTYTPQTLEAPGPEHLVINLRELDCVTFIENMLALTWLVRNEGEAILADRGRAMERYEDYLAAVRYRGGELEGYTSRLHYFTDWLADNERMGLIALRTAELGGVPDREPIDFMSTHPDAYRQLAETGALEEIGTIEARLNAAGPRIYIPEEQVAEVAERIADGDLIAATSTVAGLDVAHTGIALWQDGRLHLLHAPLVGKNVEISEKPLAERILDFSGQDGIMVARPLEWPDGPRARADGALGTAATAGGAPRAP